MAVALAGLRATPGINSLMILQLTLKTQVHVDREKTNWPVLPPSTERWLAVTHQR